MAIEVTQIRNDKPCRRIVPLSDINGVVENRHNGTAFIILQSAKTKKQQPCGFDTVESYEDVRAKLAACGFLTLGY